MPRDRFELDRPPQQRSAVARIRLRQHQEKLERLEYNRTHPSTSKAEPAAELTLVRLQHMLERARTESDETIGQLGPSRRSQKRHHGKGKFRNPQ